MRLLLVEDEVELADTLRCTLERDGFIVDHVDRLDLAREAALSGAYDLVLRDRTLPDGDGLSLVSILRTAQPSLPVIVLSARDQVTDRVEGLDEAADDYLIKPFALDELLARIRAVRRRPASLGVGNVHVGKLVFDLTHDEASVSGERLILGRRELRVLAAFLPAK